MKNPMDRARNGILQSNLALIDQALQVLANIDDAMYRRGAGLFGGQSIGGHVRHVIEGYISLMEGLEEGTVNYEARRRDPVVESERPTAIERLYELRARLIQDPALKADRTLWVAHEGSPNDFSLSSLGRELEAVQSHTVHHFALVAVLLRYFGAAAPPDFGVSGATLRYWASGKAREAA